MDAERPTHEEQLVALQRECARVDHERALKKLRLTRGQLDEWERGRQSFLVLADRMREARLTTSNGRATSQTMVTKSTGKGRGFASMDPKLRSELARKGGKSAHEQGKAHEFTPKEARAAGRLGGQATKAKMQKQKKSAVDNVSDKESEAT